jgi:hypothetical protein
MAEEICSSGLWVDNETHQVVEKEPSGPEGGRLLVAPGGVITPNVKVDIDMARAAAPVEETATEDDSDVKTADEPAGDVKTATAPNDVETASQDEDGKSATTARKRTR